MYKHLGLKEPDKSKRHQGNRLIYGNLDSYEIV